MSVLAKAAQALQLSMGRNFFAAVPQAVSGAAGFHASRSLQMPDVVVPPLGESVSEGTISTILKAPGDSVAVDEVIAQLETDKVTIDCKSPYAGKVSAVQVKIGDTVTPGTVLAVVGEGAGKAPAPQAPAASPAAPAASPAAPAAPSSSHARTPMISFPQRRLADGTRISELSAADKAAALASLQAQQPAATPHAEHAPPVSAAQFAAASKPAAPKGKVPTAPGPAVSKQTTYLDRAPSRRGLTQREIDAINMGGVF